jgi:MoaA/NifB/PqqE/SkfB family radical SAM enzyme
VKKRFSKVNIEISNICNLQCSFCPPVIRVKKLMSVEVFKRCIEEVAHLTEQVTFHLMGEPLLHPELPRFLEICSTHEVPVFFVSNGTLLTDARSELLLNPIIRQVNFSLHSFFDNYGDVDPLPYLIKIFKFVDRALTDRPDLYINFRLWNLESVDANRPTNQKMISAIEAHFDVKFPNAFDVRLQKSHKLKRRLYAHFDTEFVWPSLDLPVLGGAGTCQGLRNHFGILADGTVVPCCLDKEGNIPLGNLSESSITEILDAPRSKSILKGFLERRLIEPLCQRCNYITRF